MIFCKGISWGWGQGKAEYLKYNGDRKDLKAFGPNRKQETQKNSLQNSAPSKITYSTISTLKIAWKQRSWPGDQSNRSQHSNCWLLLLYPHLVSPVGVLFAVKTSNVVLLNCEKSSGSECITKHLLMLQVTSPIFIKAIWLWRMYAMCEVFSACSFFFAPYWHFLEWCIH